MVTRWFSVVFGFAVSALSLGAQEAASLVPKPYRAQLEQHGHVREMSLRDAIATALQCNLEIEIEGYNHEAARANTTNASAYYDPVLGLNTSAISTNVPVTNILQTGEFASQITKTWSVSPSIQQNLPGGGTAILTTNLNRVSTNSDYSLINPVLGSTFGLTITQPLLRGFLRTGAERQIAINQLNERITVSQFQQKAAAVVEQVINNYWRLAATLENYEAQRQGYAVAAAEYEESRKKNGDGPQAAVSSQRSELLSRDQILAQAAVQIIQASNGLKRLLAPSVADPLWADGIVATDTPDVKPLSITLEEAVHAAMSKRPELEQLRLQIKQSDADVRFNRQETKPTVNLRLETLATGDTGPIRDIPPGTIPPASITGGIGAATRQALAFQHPSFAAGVEIKMPVRNGAAQSQLTNALIGGHKLQAQLRAAEQDILVDVRNAWESIEAQRRTVDSTQLARRLAEEHLTAETAKPASDSQNLDVLRSRKDLEEARTRELQAQIDYQLAVVSLERAMSTLLDDQQVVFPARK
ncbi:MAG TPA: TolC family protein [Bryobacteraceae bacterium]|nr:TolC family protein [Bryobacteraceae bacterium]